MKMAMLKAGFGAAALVLAMNASTAFAEDAPVPTLAAQSAQIDQIVKDGCAAHSSRCDHLTKKGEKLKSKCTTDAAACQKDIDKWQKRVE